MKDKQELGSQTEVRAFESLLFFNFRPAIAGLFVAFMLHFILFLLGIKSLCFQERL